MAPAFTASKPVTRHAKVLLIGEAGSGKTHAALTFPKPAVIDAEGSIDWFADRFSFVSVPTKSYKDVTQLIQSVRTGQVKCDTLVIDSLTSIYNGLLNAASSEREDLRPLDWGRIKRKFSQLLDELYHQLPMHVVCVGWIKPEYAKPGDSVNGRVVGANDLVKLGETFDGDRKAMYAFDFVFRMEAKGGKHHAVVIKSRSGALKEGERIENFSFATIAALLPKGNGVVPHGMTDAEQIALDAGPDARQPADAPPEPAATPTVLLIARLRDLGLIPAGTHEQGIVALKNYAKAQGLEFKVVVVNAHLDALETADEAGESTWASKVGSDAPQPAQAPSRPTVAQQQKAMALHTKLGHNDLERHGVYEGLFGEGVDSFTKLSREQVGRLIDQLSLAVDAMADAKSTTTTS
jgi:hypothetical protein